MDKTIGLQIAGCSEQGFDDLLSINWQGKNLSDFMPRRENYSFPIAYFACIDSEYQTYEAVICKFKGLDVRHSAFQVAIRIPVGYGLIDKGGNRVSPGVVLRPILKKVVDEHLKLFEDTYEYRRRQVPVFVQSDYEALLQAYHIAPMWGPMVDMGGSRPVYVNGGSDDDIDRKLLHLPYIYRFSDAQWVEIGAFSTSVATTALTDEEMNAESEISVHINDKLGSVASRTLGVVPMHLSSDSFGYNAEIYDVVKLKLTREDVLRSFRENKLRAESKGYEVAILPTKGVVSVVFNPPLRRKIFDIQFKGNGVADREKEIGEQLLYNGNKVNNCRVAFEGAQIKTFENLSSDELRQCFSLTPLSRFILEKIRRDGSVISVTLKLKEEPKPKPVEASPAPRFQLKKESDGDTLKKLRVFVDGKEDLPEPMILTQTNAAGVISETVFNSFELVTTAESNHVDLLFAEISGSPKIELRVGRPSLYKGTVSPSEIEGVDYETTLRHRKAAFTRFFSIFKWREMSGSWPIYRAISVAVAAVFLCVLCFFAGVFSSGCGVLGEWRDVFTGQEPVETVNNDFKPEAAPEPKEEPKVDTPKELTDTTKTEEPDSITVKAPENENP